MKAFKAQHTALFQLSGKITHGHSCSSHLPRRRPRGLCHHREARAGSRARCSPRQHAPCLPREGAGRTSGSSPHLPPRTPGLPGTGTPARGRESSQEGGLRKASISLGNLLPRRSYYPSQEKKGNKKPDQKLSDRVTRTLQSQSRPQKQGRSGETCRGEFSGYPLAFRCPTFDTLAGIFKAAEGRGGTIPASLQKSQGVQSLQINKEKVMR